MKKLSKKLLVFAVSIAIIFGLSACSEKDNKEVIKIWNKTDYEISVNNNKIKQGKFIEIDNKDQEDQYNINISYDDGVEINLGKVKLSDIKENIEIKYEDGVTYIKYVTKKGDEINTKESELQKEEKSKSKAQDVRSQETQKNEVKSNIEKESSSSNNTNSHDQSDNNSKPTSSNDNCVDVDDPNNYY